MDERARAMIHDLMVAILEGRETTEDEPVPRTISVDKWRKAIQQAIRAAHLSSDVLSKAD
jgi:hypothetical protein